MTERTPQELFPIIPPNVQWSCVEGSGPKVSWYCCSAGSRRWSRISPGWTRASLAVGSISSAWFRYFEKSRTTATLQHWPARLVPPPRGSSGARCSRQTRPVCMTASTGHGGGGVLAGAEVRHGATDVSADLRRAVCGHLEAMLLRNGCRVEEAGVAAAARDVDLQAGDGVGLQQVAEVGGDVCILAGSHIDRRAFAHVTQPGEVGRADGLLEPARAPLVRVPLGPSDRVVAVKRAVRVDEQLRVLSDRQTRGVQPGGIVVRRTADLDLHARDSLRNPARELVGEALERIRGEAAAA